MKVGVVEAVRVVRGDWEYVPGNQRDFVGYSVMVEVRVPDEETAWVTACVSELDPTAKAPKGKRKRWGRGDDDHQDRVPEALAMPTALGVLGRAHVDDLLRVFGWPLPRCRGEARLHLSGQFSAVYCAGSYLKKRRMLSHSPWTIGGKMMGVGSVQERLSQHIEPLFQCQRMVFYSAGREDIDVRMLGNGRPFVFEVVDAKRIPTAGELARAEQLIRDEAGEEEVEARDVRVVPKEYTAEVKEGEQDKRKRYRAVVWVKEKVTAQMVERLSSIRDLLVQQKTPIRVMHTRTPLTRPRMIYEAHAEKISDHFIILDCVTQAGTYIKELVHGDFKRTSPSIGEILQCEADIIQLDVMGLEWASKQ